MKKIISVVLLLFVFFGLLCSCESNTIEPGEITIDEKTDFYDYYSCVNDKNCDFFETEDGYYFLNLSNNLIYYSEKDNLQFVELCNKVDCDHSGNDCNAYGGYHIGYYNGKIYSVAALSAVEGWSLVSINPDGTNHEKIADMPVVQSQSGAGSSYGGGYLYFYKGMIVYFISYTESKYNTYPVAYLVELETGKSKILFKDELKECNSMIVGFYPNNETIWFEVTDRKSGDCYYYSANLDTCEIGHRIKLNATWSTISVIDNKLVYYKKNTGFCEYSPDENTEKILKQCDYTMGQFVFGNDYIVAKVFKDGDENKREYWMAVFDKSYNVIGQVNMGTFTTNSPDTSYQFISVTSDKVFLSEGSGKQVKISHFIDLNKLSDGELIIEKIES